jgi:acyl-CoA thioesterase-1
MFELPIPPLYEGFGRVQRDLASRHGVALIPKRVLLSVVEAAEATIDSIHLTQQGHDRMASFVWALLEPAMPPESGHAESGSRAGFPARPPHHVACGSALRGSTKRSELIPE